MKSKNLVFISHVTEESELAKLISEEIKSSFLGMLDTFVSSDGESLPAGGRWLDRIDSALSDSAIQISLCSPQSVRRPWINFEAGASWIRRIPVVPVCHSGLSKSGLPVPLSMLQAADLTSVTDMKVVFAELAKVLGASKTPEVDYSSFIAKCEAFIGTYTYFNGITQAVYAACEAHEELKPLFFSGELKSMPVSVRDYLFIKLAPALDTLSNLGLVNYTFNTTFMDGTGTYRRGHVTLTDKFLSEIHPRLAK